jgi:phosphoenolpyruvate synthase/pyruvate phosphate dikinase
MGVIVQTFIEPDWSGVMYTSNPSYSPDLAIEFVMGENTIVDGTADPFILDFDKESRELVFKSENLNELCGGSINYDVKGLNIDKLVKMGIELEKRTFPSDVEFVVKNRRIYFVQQRKITDLEEPVKVTIPEYKPEQLIGSTHMKRGSGKVTLPVVSIGSLTDLATKLQILTQIAPEEYENQIRSYFKSILENDKKYESGYLLLIPHVAETVMPAWSLIVPEISIDATMDNITPNKKAVISTRYGSICSHMMTVSRERGIPYASFSMSDELFDGVHTGDVLSMYFTEREAYVFKEENKSKSIREEHPEISFLVDEFEGSMFSAQTSSYLDSWIPYIEDFEYFLSESTEKNWKFTEWEGQMGGYFTNESGKQIVMDIVRSDGEWHRIGFPDIEWHERCGYEPLPENEFKEIMQQYQKHLTE